MEEDNPLMTLCAVACSFRERDATTSGLQNNVTSGLQEHHDLVFSQLHEQLAADFKARKERRASSTNLAFKSYNSGRLMRLKEIYNAKIENIDLKSLPNCYINDYIENTSDELSRKFSFKCKFSPDVCSEVKESYGSEEKAFSEIKWHLIRHHSLADLVPSSSKKPKKIISNPKQLKTLKKAKEDKSILQQPTEGNDKEENVHMSLDKNFEANDSSSILNTIKYGEFEHTYSKSPHQVYNAVPSIRETGRRKNRRQNVDLTVCKFDLNKHLNSNFFLSPATIGSPPFPFVYIPYPLEASCNVELDSNGDPIHFKEAASAEPSTSEISTEAIENKMNRKNSKSIPDVNVSRSVLECVENRVACKSNASSDQKDAILQEVNIENSENVEESIREIAYKNIEMLTQQRKKRRYRDKPTDYVCEICNKRFTANTSLTYHYMGHLKIKPFTCKVCKRDFTRRHSLKYHMMIHDNTTRFQCDTCNRLFRHPSHYKEHLRKHTGEEPFSCKFCSNKFKTRNSYKRHLKMQHQKLLTSNGIVPISNDS